MTALFEQLRADYPHLHASIDHDHDDYDINMSIGEQTGLAFDVGLHLQEDELCLSAGAFWLEWFP